MVLSLNPQYRYLEKPLSLALRRALFYLRQPKRPVQVFLVANGEMRRINRVFRGKDKVTNVLSFEFDERLPYPKNLPRPLGEIYLAPDYIRRMDDDSTALLVHGLVHLLGYTHKRRNDKILMERLEKKTISRIA